MDGNERVVELLTERFDESTTVFDDEFGVTKLIGDEFGVDPEEVLGDGGVELSLTAKVQVMLDGDDDVFYSVVFHRSPTA